MDHSPAAEILIKWEITGFLHWVGVATLGLATYSVSGENEKSERFASFFWGVMANQGGIGGL